MRLTRHVTALLGVCAVIVTACTPAGDKLVREQAPAGSDIVKQTLSSSGGRASTSGWTVTVPSARAGDVLTLKADVALPQQSTKTVSGATLGTHPVEVTMSGPLRVAATVKFVRDTPLPADQVAALAYWDERADTWRSVPTRLAADRRTLTATVRHFSFWDDLYYNLGKVVTKRTDAPTCTGKVPAWVEQAIYFDDKNAPLLWCVGRDPAHPDVFVVKVKANRAYGFALRPAVQPEWFYSSLARDLGIEELMAAAVSGRLGPDNEVTRGLNGLAFVAPGTGVDMGFTERQIRSASGRPLLKVDPDLSWGVAGAVYDLIAEAVGSVNRGAAVLFALAAAVQCGQELGDERTVRGVGAALLRCATKSPEAIVAVVVELGVRSSRQSTTDIAKAARTAWKALVELAAFAIGAQIGEAISDTRLGAAAFQISVLAKPLPPSFVGEWYVHGSQFPISSTSRGSEVSNVGQCGPGDILDPNRPWCEERVDYRFRLSADGRSLHATVISAQVVESQTGRPHPEIETSSKAGDQFTLRFAGPNQLIRSPAQGNPYLCNQRTPERRQQRCGA
jgi:hypothetical protein